MRTALPVLAALGLGIGLTLVLVGTLLAGSAEEAPGNTVVSLQGPSGPLQIGETFTVTIHISDVVDLYGAQASLAYTPAHLQVVDANPVLDGLQITPGACPVPDFVVVNSADNLSGAIDYAVTQLSPTPPVSGSCDMAYMRFQAQQAATTVVQFEELLLSDLEGIPIPAAWLDLEIEIVPPPAMEESKVYLPVVLRGVDS